MANDTLSNIDAERGLLGALMLDNGNLHHVAGLLEPEHFFVAEHADIYRTLRTIVNEGRTASPISLKPAVGFQKVGEQSAALYLMQLAVNPASAVVLRDYAEQIIDLHLRRQLLLASEEIAYTARQQGGKSAAALLEFADSRIAEIRAQSPSIETEPEAIDEVTDACIQHLADVMAGKVEPAPSTGLVDLDRRVGGYVPGRLYLVAGRPGQGKTVFGVAGLRSVAGQRKPRGGHYGAVYFSLEVPYRDIWSRLVSNETAAVKRAVAYQQIQQARRLTDGQAEEVIASAHGLRDLAIHIVDRPAMTVAQVETKIREVKQSWAKRGQSLDVVFIDYLGLMSASERYRGQRVNEIGEISSGLLAISKRLNVAVVALQQLSRAVESREDKHPLLSDLRDSGNLEQDANSVILLYRPAYYAAAAGLPPAPGEDNLLELGVAKARDGSPGVVKVWCDVATNTVMNMGRD
jgi:replicative DNA helicase